MAVEGVVDLIELVVRFVGRLITETFVEFLCRKIGSKIGKMFNKTINPDSFVAFFIGFAFWVILVVLIFFAYDKSSRMLALDKSLDNGGKFDHQNQVCKFD